MTEDRSVMSFFPHPGFNSRKRLSPRVFLSSRNGQLFPDKKKKRLAGATGKEGGKPTQTSHFPGLNKYCCQNNAHRKLNVSYY